MITWVSSEEMSNRLASFGPIGLWLRPFFIANYAVESSPPFPVSHETEVLAGLMPSTIWNGFVDDVPFVISGAVSPYNYMGLEVRLPVFRGGDYRAFDTISCLPLRGARGIYIEPLPGTAQFGVFDEAGNKFYRTRESELAHRAAACARELTGTAWNVVGATTADHRWYVVGPPTGEFYSVVEVEKSEEAAKRQAEQFSKKSGFPFEALPSLP